MPNDDKPHRVKSLSPDELAKRRIPMTPQYHEGIQQGRNTIIADYAARGKPAPEFVPLDSTDNWDDAYRDIHGKMHFNDRQVESLARAYTYLLSLKDDPNAHTKE
jgi:hypothetical protein